VAFGENPYRVVWPKPPQTRAPGTQRRGRNGGLSDRKNNRERRPEPMLHAAAELPKEHAAKMLNPVPHNA